MPVAAVSGAVGLYGAHQAGKAAKAQGKQAQAGLDFSKGIYSDAQGNFQPYLGAGQNALAGLTAMNSGDYSGFMNSPDYLYAREQAIYGGDHSASAGGRLDSGGYPVDLANAINGIATQNLGNYRNSLQYLTGLGQNSAGQLAGFGNQTAQMVNQQGKQLGQAQASGYGAQAGALAGLGNTFADWYSGRPATASSYGSSGGYSKGGY